MRMFMVTALTALFFALPCLVHIHGKLFRTDLIYHPLDGVEDLSRRPFLLLVSNRLVQIP